MRFLTRVAAAAFALAGAAHAEPSTFAQFNQSGSADTIRVTNDTGSTGTIVDINNPTVTFDFLLPQLVAAGLGTQQAVFDLNGVITNPASLTIQVGPDPINQLINSGTLSFTRTTPAPVGTALGARTNLLTIQFTNALLTGFSGGTSGSLLASTPDSALIFTSDFISFSNVQSMDFALGLSSITGGGLGRVSAAESVRAFTSDSTGTFSTDPAAQDVVPEPGMLGLLGIGVAGLALARRRKAA